MFGFLNIYKPTGMTSHDVVSVLRRITKIKQIGHTGTLDPFAEGVLPVCIGKATRLIEYLDDDKAYGGRIKLGESTTTYDTEGEIVNKSDKKPDLSEIEDVIKNFRGEIIQYPPMYSAIKVRGKKLYEYARKGEEVEVQPRKVCISKLEIINYNKDLRELELYIECSKGTYIRSIANDIGEALGSYGHLNRLIRVKAGKFVLGNAIKLEDIKKIEDVENNLINPLKYLEYPQYKIDSTKYQDISNGKDIDAKINDGIVIITDSENILAVGKASNGIIKPQKVFI